MVFYALFVCGHYFVQYGLSKSVFSTYFFGKLVSFFFLCFLCLLLVYCLFIFIINHCLCKCHMFCDFFFSLYYKEPAVAGRVGGYWPRNLKKNAKNDLWKIMKTSTCYFYLVKVLEEEFHGLYKAYNIKSRLNYNRGLEGG